MTSPTQLSLCGDRFTAVYRILCPPDQVEARARDICVEQTIEFPGTLVTDAAIRDQIIGQIQSLQSVGPDRFEAVISYAVETVGRELTQLINVLFGNISIKPGVRLVGFELPDSLASQYRGPRFGQTGLRELVGVDDRPLLCTAVKPMGLDARALADLAYRLALGGIHLIKDDHGLCDQAFCRYEERVSRCAEAVERANRETGQHSLYLPNVTAPVLEVERRSHVAKQAGAGGLLVCPGLAGLDAMRVLADDDTLALPILSHPAFQGSFCVSPDAGLSHGVLFGQLNRLAGADATIFPNWGGRFSFTQDECRDLVAGATRPLSGLKPIFPVPAGGMRLDRVVEMCDFYGRDCILLIGGDLHAQGRDLVGSCRHFANLTVSHSPVSVSYDP
jgi:ribulose-bisphosphate carboxylase large chain